MQTYPHNSSLPVKCDKIPKISDLCGSLLEARYYHREKVVPVLKFRRSFSLPISKLRATNPFVSARNIDHDTALNDTARQGMLTAS